LQAANTEVVGVSPDSADKLLRYAKEKQLPFPFASDSSRTISSAWGITAGLLGGIQRLTFVVERGGTIRTVISHNFRMANHAKDALSVVQGLS
jgi:peroxiredoxin Q/BCP